MELYVGIGGFTKGITDLLRDGRSEAFSTCLIAEVEGFASFLFFKTFSDVFTLATTSLCFAVTFGLAVAFTLVTAFLLTAFLTAALALGLAAAFDFTLIALLALAPDLAFTATFALAGFTAFLAEVFAFAATFFAF
ncbi:MAG: hypothetical protein R2847_00275 [Bacteroidia bacterium]